MILNKKGGGNSSQYLAGLSAALTIFTAGTHFGWPMPSLKKIMSDEYPFTITPDEASYIAIVSSVGHVIGGILGPILTDIIGRKSTLLAISVPQVWALMMIYFSYYGKYLLYCARIAGGIGEGAILVVLPLYLGEIAVPSIRGTLNIMCCMAFPIGALFINIVGSYLNIYKTALICLFSPILFWLTYTNIHESPYYLLMKGYYKAAEESLQILRRNENVESELRSLKKDVERQMSEYGGFRELFMIESNRKALVLMSCARIIQQFSGCSAYGTYAQILIEETTNISPLWGSCSIYVMIVAIHLASGLFIDKVGRKILLSLSAGTTCAVLLLLGTFCMLKDYIGLDLNGVSWLPLLLLLLFWLTFTFGMGVATMTLISEFFSTSIKSKALAICSIVYALCTMSTIKYYQYTADNFSLAITFYTFAGFMFLGVLFYHFILPESRGKTLESIQQELKGNTI